MSLHAIFLWCIEETHSNISTRVNQKKIKSSWKEYVSSTCVKYLPLKNIFKKKKKRTIEVWLWLITNLSRTIVACEFSFKRGIIPSLTK